MLGAVPTSTPFYNPHTRRWRMVQRLLLATTALAPFGLAAAFANPQGGQVVGGSAAISGTGTPTVTVTQSSQNAVINWQSFNIGAGETTQFIQPNSAATVLNRVTGDANPSQIFGTLSANGRVFLINPNGVLIGNGATINTAGFLATTHDIANSDFMAGNYNFNIPGNPSASVVNLGTITATDAGFAALVAPGVRNSGTITAKFGKVALASANGFTLDPYGDQLIMLSVSDSIAAQVKDVATGETLKSLVQNDGKLSANGGRVELTAVAARQVVDSLINNKGVIEARSIGRRQGRIVLGAPTASTKVAGAPTQTVRVSGTLSVSSARRKGGTILITGENIELAGATLDASGPRGGGKVLIGGDVGGGNPSPLVTQIARAQLENEAIPNATTVSIDAATSINASAIGSGDGGKVVVWADGATAFGGNIVARGGAAGGDGGFAEVSGKETLTYAGLADTRAPMGRNGTLLLDPANFTIGSVNGANEIAAATLQGQLANGNVIITNNAGPGDGDIIVSASVFWNTGTTLTLSAFRNIQVNSQGATNTATLNPLGSSGLVLRADNTGTGIGTLVLDDEPGFDRRIDASATTGAVTIYYNPTSYTSPTDFTSGNGRIYTSGPNQLTAYMLVNNSADLQNVGTNLSGNYALGRDINMSGYPGFVPIGNGSAFSGKFFGDNFTISNLTINSPLSDIGLFSSIANAAEVGNLKLLSLSVTSTATGSTRVGGLAGTNNGLVEKVLVISGTVVGNQNDSISCGGSNCGVGGLIGNNLGSISDSSSSASVTGGRDNAVGGLVGKNNSTIVRSSAKGAVLQNGLAGEAGGLVGWNQGGMISHSYAIGPVTNTSAGGRAGGLVSLSDLGGTIIQSYSVGLVSGASVGGLIAGTGFGGQTVTDSYWDYQTSGTSSSAGGVGLTTAALKAGLPLGFDSNVWAISSEVNNGYPYLIGGFEGASISISGSPNIPDNIFSPPQFANVPPSGSDPPLILIALNQPGSGPGPGPGGPGANPGAGQGGNAFQNATPGTPGFTPPQLPQRPVFGPDGETWSSIPPPGETRFAQNQILMQLNFNLTDADLARIVAPLGIRVVTTDALTIHGRNMFQLVLPPGMSVREAIRILESNRLVSVAAPIYQFFLAQAPSAPTKGDPAQYMIGKLGLESVHRGSTGKGVTIAVIDSEVDKRHSELKEAISKELDAVGAKETPHSHGTAMAGAIASRDRLLGVAPDAKILAIRAFGESSSSAEGTTVSIIKGIEWAVSQGAKVINMSFAGPRDPSLERALKAAADKGVVLIAAAGNAGPKSPPLYPAADPNVIAVTATDVRDRVFRGANNGPQLSVAAPGVEILAPAPDENYQLSTGTSIATAHISGVVALMLERDPSLKPADVRRILEATATDLGSRGKDAQFGWGLVNPQKALEAVDARRKTADASLPRRASR